MASGTLVLLSTLLVSATWAFYSWYCLLLNYLTARTIGVLIVLIPISPENPVWMLVDKKFFIPFFERLPFGSGSFTRYNWRGWEFKDKNKSHLEMGDVFVVVSPGRNALYVCEAEALVDISRKRADFPRPPEIFGAQKYPVSSCCHTKVRRNDEGLWRKSVNSR